jgi:hypothetical protein
MRLFRRRSGGTPPRLRLLSRPGCHLCEALHAAVRPLVERLGGSLQVVDIDADPAVAARWGNEIPVLLDSEGRVVAKARDGIERIARRLGV